MEFGPILSFLFPFSVACILAHLQLSMVFQGISLPRATLTKLVLCHILCHLLGKMTNAFSVDAAGTFVPLQLMGKGEIMVLPKRLLAL